MADAKNTKTETTENLKTIAVKVPAELHNSVKLAALVAGKSVTEFATSLFETSVKGIKVTNTSS